MAQPQRIRPALWLAILALVLHPVTALALSLGEIEVTGSYKKQFSAQFPAYVDGREELEVELGDVADYIKVGARRPTFIDDLSLIVTDHPSVKGAKLVRVVSSGPIATPSFHLVVKARQGTGRVMENYFLAVDFQRKLAVESPASEEGDDDLLRIAEEMRRLRVGLGPTPTPQPGVVELPEEEADDMIAQLRKEERKADARDRDTDPPAPPAPTADQKMIDRMRKEETVQARAEAAHPTPTPEPVLYTNDDLMTERPNEPGTIVVTGDTVERAAEPAPTLVADEIADEPMAPPTEEPSPAGRPLLVRALETGGDYTVHRGDTLSEVAQAAGEGLKMTPQLVVALWKLNQAAFINGNIHGVRAGAELSFAGVMEEAARLSRTEAARILQTQWEQWTGRTGDGRGMASTTSDRPTDDGEPSSSTESAATPSGAPPTKTDPRKIKIRSAALAIVTSWRDKEKEDELDLDQATMGERAEDRLEVTAPKKDDPNTLVTLILKRNADGSLTVVDRVESTVGQKVADDPKAARRFVAHVASFKDKAKASQLVSILRRRGYDAYETGARLDGEGEWYRVAVGRFGDREAGFAFARSFRAETGLSYTRLLDLPYALQVGLPADRATAQASVDRMEGDGIFGAYILPNRENDGENVVMLGAFATPDELKSAMNVMKEKGYDVSQAIP